MSDSQSSASTGLELEPLASNAIESITLKLYGPPDISQTQQTLHRKDGVIRKTVRNGSELQVVTTPPSRAPAQLPGNLHLQLRLDEYIVHGHASVVYAASASLLDNLGHVLGPASLPPLVAKISLPEYRDEREREMALYAEMAPLQGVAVPRCYGLFEGVVRDALASIIPPKGQEQPQAWDKSRPVCGMGRRPTAINGVVSILLLERLDVHLPFEVPISSDIRKEIYDLYSELAALGIQHDSICIDTSSHVMYALPEQGAGPQAGKYRLRLIDFATSSRESDGEVFKDEYDSEFSIDTMLQAREWGRDLYYGCSPGGDGAVYTHYQY